MNSKIDWQFLWLDTRARVYLLWAFLATVGFVATHYFQRKQINGFWTLLSLVGMGYMFRVMPLKVRQMKRIFMCWLIAIFVGMLVSGAVFIFDGPVSSYLISHLGGFWLVLMALAYAANGWVDRPATWYLVAAAINAVFGLFCLTMESFLAGQYLIAAVASAWSMLYLWLFRTS